MKKSQLVKYPMLVIAFIMMNPYVFAQTPKMVYSTYLGGSGYDYGHSITVDASGNVYLAGQTSSTNFPTTSGAYDRTANGSADIYVTKLNKDGNALIYSTYIGGSDFDDTRKVLIDKSGNVYLAGSTRSTNFPITSNSPQSNEQGYFLKLDSLGSKITYSSRWTAGEKTLLDSEGNLIILGGTNSLTFPTTANAYSRTNSGNDDIFLTKINLKTNTIIFSTYLGGSGSEYAVSMALDSQNNIIIVGGTSSQNFPVTGNSFVTPKPDVTNVFVTKIKSDGSKVLFSTLIGGSEGADGTDVALDANENIYVTGSTSSSDFPVSSSAFSTKYNSGGDAYVFKLSSDGRKLLYSTYIGGTKSDGARGIVVDKYGKAYITGCTNSTNFPISTDAYSKTYNGGGTDVWSWGDTFLLVLNEDGSKVTYSTYLGGKYDEEAYGIAMDNKGDVYLCGVTPSPNFPTTEGAYSRTLRGGCNIYVTKFSFNTDYFGQTPPGDKAVVFAPGIISLPDRNETNITFSPDGNEVYLEGNDGIYYTKRVNNTWSQQIKEPIFNGFGTPVFSANGKKMYLTKWSSDYSTSDIWIAERTSTVWSAPQILPVPFNPSSTEGGYTETDDGALYISSNRSGKWNIWCIRPSATQAENLGSVINNPSASDPCIAHDGSYLIFWSDRPGSIGIGDLYVSFNKGNNLWTAPINIESSGAGINQAKYNVISPSLSPDGKYLFMNRHSFDLNAMPDIYWVSTHILVGLKKTAYAPKLSNQIPNASIKADTVFNYIIPSTTFSCEYGTEILKYTATLSDGSALPSWLTFNAGTRTLSGNPKQAEAVNIKITVTNADTVSATCTFKITITKTTGIDKSNNQLPTEFKLCQNYPNPFNPSTVINYQIPFAGNVSLKVYDILGNEVATLVDQYKQSGFYSAQFSTSNLRLSSGVYLYSLIANGKSMLKKMMLIR